MSVKLFRIDGQKEPNYEHARFYARRSSCAAREEETMNTLSETKQRDLKLRTRGEYPGKVIRLDGDDAVVEFVENNTSVQRKFSNGTTLHHFKLNDDVIVEKRDRGPNGLQYEISVDLSQFVMHLVGHPIA
jgi:hypothetical protein